MRRTFVTLALAGTVGLSGAVLLTPGANAQSSSAVSGRLSAIADALKGLVSDGTLTQTQADKVAATLDSTLPHRGHGPHGGRGGVGPAEVAAVLGVTVDELRTQLQAGKTLAEVAASKGIAKPALIDKLVAAGEKALAAKVASGQLTQAEADARKAGLRAKITEKVDQVGGLGRGGHGPGGHGPGRGHHGSDGPTATTPSAQASPASATA